MKLNWSELSKGDKLYLLIPFKNDKDIITYKYQESEVINIKFNLKYKTANLRFKYTNELGKRIRIEITINKSINDKEYLIYNKNRSFFKEEVMFGSIIICHDNPEQLDNIHRMMIHKAIDELQEKINHYKENMNYLENQKYVSIINR